jgi:hypothetical protein
MAKLRLLLLSIFAAMLFAGCASPSPSGESRGGLVGAWIVTASRPAGVGKNLLTFSSDGTFFRSGDTHPVLSGAHGAWKQVGNKEFDATYIAFRFDENRKWIGSTKTRIRIIAGPGDNEFTGVAKVSTRDLQDKAIGTSESRLEGKRLLYSLKFRGTAASLALRSKSSIFPVTMRKVPLIFLFFG